MFSSSYSKNWVLNNNHKTYYCNGSLFHRLCQKSVSGLRWPKNLNFLRCIQVLDLCSNVVQTLMKETGYTLSVVYCFGEYSCIVDWNGFRSSTGLISGWNCFELNFFRNVSNWIPNWFYDERNDFAIFLIMHGRFAIIVSSTHICVFCSSALPCDVIEKYFR